MENLSIIKSTASQPDLGGAAPLLEEEMVHNLVEAILYLLRSASNRATRLYSGRLRQSTLVLAREMDLHWH